jgi:hypothetical protein
MAEHRDPGKADPGKADPGKADPGKALYEERLKLLEGLWMPAAPPWEDLPDEVKERWRAHAADDGPSGST